MNFFPNAVSKARSSKRKTTTKAKDISTPVGTVKASGAGGYEEEWIPEHHLRKGKKGGNKSDGGLSSGDEGAGKKKGKRS